MNAVKAVSARTSSVSSTSPPPLSPPFVASSNSPSRRATTASPTTPPITDEQQPSAQRVYDSGNSQWSSASTHFSPNSIRDVSPAPTFLSASPTPSSVQSFASQHQTFIPGSTAQDTSSLFVPQFTSNSYQQQQQHHVNAGIDMSFSLPVGAHTTWSACSSMISDLNSNHFSGGVFSLPNNSTIHSPNPLPQSNLQSPPYSQPSTSRPLPSSSSSSSDPTHSHHLMSTPLDELTAVLGATTSDDTLDAFFGMDLEFDMFHPPASSTIITHNNNTIHESVSATAAEYTAVYPSETDPLDALFLPLSGLGPQPPTHYHPSQQEQHQQQSIKAFQALERAHNKFASTLYTTQPYNPYPPPSTQYLSPQNHHQQQHHQFGYDPVSPLTLSASHTSSTSTTLTSLPDPFELGHFSAPAGLGPGLSVLGMTLDPNTTSISPAPDDGPSSQPQSHHHHHRVSSFPSLHFISN
ncbi:hypothetical protein DFS34DRAFT_353828 [Phlyctochytrium arcticum]|nr:hypothetical protein DFS34DRAFT_353828 [Phlyctochytrium arcticum]